MEMMEKRNPNEIQTEQSQDLMKLNSKDPLDMSNANENHAKGI